MSILSKNLREDSSGYRGTGDFSVVVETMVRLRTVLENQLDYKKKKKEESMNCWSKLLLH